MPSAAAQEYCLLSFSFSIFDKSFGCAEDGIKYYDTSSGNGDMAVPGKTISVKPTIALAMQFYRAACQAAQKQDKLCSRTFL